MKVLAYMLIGLGDDHDLMGFSHGSCQVKARALKAIGAPAVGVGLTMMNLEM